MAEVERIADWRGEDVLDAEGEKVGKLDEVYVRTGTEEAVFGRVKRGFMGRRSLVVPLLGVTVGRAHVRIGSTPDQLDRAAEVGAPDLLTKELGQELAAIYGLQVPEGADYEAVTILDARRQRAREARERAEELEEKARLRAEDLQVAQGEAERSAADVQDAHRQAEEARRQAEQARAEADASRE